MTTGTKLLNLVQGIVVWSGALPLTAIAAGLAGELVPLQRPDLANAKLAVDNLATLAATQTGAAKVKTERLAVAVKNLFSAEHQILEAVLAGRKSARKAAEYEHASQEWMKPNAFGRVNDDAARQAVAQAADLRAEVARRVTAAQQQLVRQLQETESVVQDFYKLQEFEVARVLAETAATVEQRSLPEDWPRSFSPAAVAQLRAAIRQRRAANAAQPPNLREPTPEEVDLAASLDRDIAAAWQDEKTAAKDLPPRLPGALTARLDKLHLQQPCSPADLANGRFAGLLLATAIDLALGSQPPDLHAVAAWCACGQRLPAREVPWLERIVRMVEVRRTESLALQQQAMVALLNGDAQAAESRLHLANCEFPSPSLSAYFNGLTLFNRLSQDPALRASDLDWNTPGLPDPSLIGQASQQIVTLRAAGGPEIFPAWAQLTAGLEAAELLDCVLHACQPAGASDTPHPIRACRTLRKTVKYRALLATDSLFVRSFIRRLQTLEERLAPQTALYEQLLARARGLATNASYREAAAQYRLAFQLEASKDLERTIARCDAQAAGL